MTRYNKCRLVLTSVTLGAVLGGGCNAVAQATPASTPPQAGVSELETVIVTARRRVENLQKVPASIVAVSSATLDKTGVFNVQDLSRLAPSLGVTASVSNRSEVILSIRGQGKTYGTQFPSVIPYFAEVPLQRLTTGFFFDLDNLQVLRGPQGTLFGRNTDGGALLLQPKRPTDSYSGYGEVKVGDYNLHDFEGAINLPIVDDKVLFRGAFDIDRRNGFTKNLTTGAELDNVNYDSFRGSLILRPISGLENYTVIAYYEANENGSGPKLSYVNSNTLSSLFTLFGFPPATVNSIVATAESDLAEQQAIGPRETRLSISPFSRRRTFFTSDELTYNITPDILVKNIFGYVNQKEFLQGDFDGSTLPLVDTVSDLPQVSLEQFTDELQLQGRSFDDRLKWIGGLYYDRSRPASTSDPTNVIELLVLRVREPTDNNSESKAVFGQATYDLGDWVRGVSFTGGVRYTQDKISEYSHQTVNGGCQAGFPAPSCSLSLGPTNFSATTWTLGLDYQYDSTTLFYVTAHRGYKTGGFNVTFPTPSAALYQPEHLLDQEIGVKKDWRFGGVEARLDADIYHGDLTDSQKVVTEAVGGQAFTFVANVPDATVQGIEVEGTLIPIPRLELNLNYAYTDAHFTRGLPSFPVSTTFGGTPLHQVDFSAHYTVDFGATGQLMFGGDVYHQSAEALGDTNGLPGVVGDLEPSYTVLNLDATLQNIGGRHIDLGAFITNATDTVYRIGDANVSNSLGIAAALYSPPRMFGFSLKYHFGGG